MRVLQLIDTLSLGGSERMAVNISNVLLDDKNVVMLVTTREGGCLEKHLNSKVDYLCLGKKGPTDLPALYKLCKLVRSFKPDVIHAHSSSVFWAIIVSFFIKNKAKIIWHDHLGSRRKQTVFNNLPYITMSIFIDYIICVNKELCDWSKRFMFVQDTHIQYVPNFPFLQDCKFKKEEPHKINIVNVANLHEPKDHLNLLKSFNIVLKSLDDSRLELKLILVGRFDNNSTYYKDLEIFIEENQLINHCVFLGEVHDIERVLNISSIGIVSSNSEGLPVSLLEYGLAGLSVVVTDVGNCSEVVVGGKYGIVVPVNNPDDMARAIKSLIVDPSKARRMGLDFKNHVNKNYGSNMFKKLYYSILQL